MMDPDENRSREHSQHDEVGKLGHIVGQEAHRVLTEEQLRPNPQLIAAGWERRFITDGRRVQEMIELYTELGYEVHVEPVEAQEFSDDCEDCALVALLKFVTIYTRRKTIVETGHEG